MTRNLLILISLLTLNINLYSQKAEGKKPKPKFKISGSFGVYNDFYKMKSDTVGAIPPRRPSCLGRVVASSTFSFGQFSIPFTMSISSSQRSPLISVPGLPSGNFFKDIKSNVTNPLNRIGIAPKYKWCQVLLGSQIPSYSDLSVGDIPVFGAGIALMPGKFRFSAFAGKSQNAINRDSALGVAGAYARKIYSFKIGIGHEDSSHIYLISSMMKDDTNSVTKKPISALPQNGLLTAIDFRINMGKLYYLKSEIASSVFTRNQFSSNINTFRPNFPSYLFEPKYSSRMDYAGIVAFGKNGKIFSIKTVGKYYGDGFVSLGFPFLQTDRFEVTIEPKVNLFKNKVNYSSAIGRRINNLSGTMSTTTAQIIGNANISILFSKRLSIVADYSNFGIRNNQSNDTLKLENVTNSWSISPNYSFTSKTSSHNINLLYAQNAFTDFNTISGAINNNDAVNGVLSYSISMLKNPLSVSTVLSYFKNNISIGNLRTNSANITTVYSFFKKKLKTTLGVTVSENLINNVDNGFQTMLNTGIKYSLKKKFNFNINGSLNLFKFGATRPGISYRENLLRTSIIYQF